MNKDKGFSLIELLVVISIIGVLASVIISNLGKARTKAKNTIIATYVINIDKALQTSLIFENRYEWPTDAQIGLGVNPTLDALRAQNSGYFSTLTETLPITPDVGDGFTIYYHYNNLDTIEPCTTVGNTEKGVVIGVEFSGTIGANEIELFTDLDRIIDNSDGVLCGKIRASADLSTTIYLLSPTPTIK